MNTPTPDSGRASLDRRGHPGPRSHDGQWADPARGRRDDGRDYGDGYPDAPYDGYYAGTEGEQSRAAPRATYGDEPRYGAYWPPESEPGAGPGRWHGLGSARAEAGPGAEEAEKEEKPRFFGLSIPQLLGGAFAAVSTAVVASFLGTAGTLVGAALGSIVSTVTAAVYTTLASSAQDRVQSQFTRSRPAVASSDSDGVITVDSRGSGSLLRRSLRLKPMLAAAGIVFVVAVGVITAIEVGIGRPVSAATGGGTGSTSLGQVVQDVTGGSSNSTTPSDSTSPTADSGQESGDVTTPTADATTDGSTQPTDGATQGGDATGGATQQPTATSEPTAQPTPDAPAATDPGVAPSAG